jgi:hypothetical protein
MDTYIAMMSDRAAQFTSYLSHSLTLDLNSSELGSMVVGLVLAIVACLAGWVYFARKEKAATAKCRKTLQTVFKNNNGEMWVGKYRDHWQKSSSPLSKWAGVEVQDLGAGDVVTEINMRDNKNFIGM